MNNKEVSELFLQIYAAKQCIQLDPKNDKQQNLRKLIEKKTNMKTNMETNMEIGWSWLLVKLNEQYLSELVRLVSPCELKPEKHLHVSMLTIRVIPEAHGIVEQIVNETSRQYNKNFMFNVTEFACFPRHKPRFVTIKLTETTGRLSGCATDIYNKIIAHFGNTKMQTIKTNANELQNCIETLEYDATRLVELDQHGNIIRELFSVRTDELGTNNFHISITKDCADKLETDMVQKINSMKILPGLTVVPTNFVYKRKTVEPSVQTEVKEHWFIHNIKLHGKNVTMDQTAILNELMRALGISDYAIKKTDKGSVQIHISGKKPQTLRDDIVRFVPYGKEKISYKTSK